MNKNKSLFRISLIVATLLWMLTIFMLSSQAGEMSSQLSDSIGEKAKVLFPVLNQLDGEQFVGGMAVVRFCVRKMAHFSAYAMLSMLILSTLYTFKIKRPIKIILAFFIAVLYAVSDEIHQYFIPGRDCKFFDVCVDSFGIICGIIILTCLILPFMKYLSLTFFKRKAEKIK